MNKVLVCPKCQSTSIGTHSPRICKFKVINQFRCKTCGTRFSIDPSTNTPSTVKNRSLFPYSLIQKCILLRIEGKELSEIKKLISEEYNIKVGRRTIQTWLRDWRRKLQECELSLWEEVTGILVKTEKNGSERKLTIYCERMLFVISVPREYAKGSRHLGKKISILKTDIQEKPFIIRIANQMWQ